MESNINSVHCLLTNVTNLFFKCDIFSRPSFVCLNSLLLLEHSIYLGNKRPILFILRYFSVLPNADWLMEVYGCPMDFRCLIFLL